MDERRQPADGASKSRRKGARPHGADNSKRPQTQRANLKIESAGDTKERLMRAAEDLFIRNGIDGTQIREINELAGQRNPSAIHYHFGSKRGLVRAILRRHQEAVEIEVRQRLDHLVADKGRATVRELIEAMVRPLCRELDTPSGRNFLRIVPFYIPELDANLRQGVAHPATSQAARLLGVLEARLQHLPQAVKRERLVAYTLVLTNLLADRARHLEEREPPTLGAEQFITHVLDMTEAVIVAPSHIEQSQDFPSPGAKGGTVVHRSRPI